MFSPSPLRKAHTKENSFKQINAAEPIKNVSLSLAQISLDSGSNSSASSRRSLRLIGRVVQKPPEETPPAKRLRVSTE